MVSQTAFGCKHERRVEPCERKQSATKEAEKPNDGRANHEAETLQAPPRRGGHAAYAPWVLHTSTDGRGALPLPLHSFSYFYIRLSSAFRPDVCQPRQESCSGSELTQREQHSNVSSLSPESISSPNTRSCSVEIITANQYSELPLITNDPAHGLSSDKALNRC